MRFDRVRLENFKCYADADLRLDRGVTVIHGLNGSGKSSLLEACFFALYGSKALDTRNLEDVITKGADDAEIELWFTHDGDPYHVERRLRTTGERAQTAKCVLETPEGEIDGARDVRSYVTELLRMDAEAFVNCAYVRQGEVNKLIHASPADRQDMIDDLLQLGKLEEYRERASQARLGVKTVRDGYEDRLDGVVDQIEAKEAKGLHARQNELETELAEVTSEIDRLEEQKATAEDTRDEAQAVLDEYEEKRDELSDLESEIEELRDTVQETERERERLQERIRERRSEIEDLEGERDELLAETDLAADPTADEVASHVEELEADDDEKRERLTELQVAVQEHTSEAETFRERAEELEAEREDARSDADDLDSDVESDEETIEERRAKLDELDEEIATKREQFADEPIEFGEATEHLEERRSELTEVRDEVADLTARIETERERIRDAEALLDAGKCPECGQPVEDSPHVESLEDDRAELAALEDELDELEERRQSLEEAVETAERLVEIEREVRELESNRKSVRQLVAEKEEMLAEKRERRDELRTRAEELTEEIEAKRDAADRAESEADDRREEIATINRERREIRERIERLERIEAVLDRVDEADNEVEELRERRESKRQLNDERRERLREKRERKAALKSEYDDDRVEEARAERQRAERYIEQAADKLEALRSEEADLRDEIGGVKNEIGELEDLRDRRDDLEATVERLDSLYEEAHELQQLYGDLRGELRQRNVESLEQMVNEVFDLVYGNDSYSHIELDGEYELTVYQKDGATLDPEQLSGGERALFNLSLRCAIYRLLAEGIEGAAPLPPLILDEPTVFLDAGHVTRLVELIDSMRELGVEQIVVVSHDDELVDAADELVRVRKNARTNRSTVERVEIGSLAVAE